MLAILSNKAIKGAALIYLQWPAIAVYSLLSTFSLFYLVFLHFRVKTTEQNKLELTTSDFPRYKLIKRTEVCELFLVSVQCERRNVLFSDRDVRRSQVITVWREESSRCQLLRWSLTRRRPLKPPPGMSPARPPPFLLLLWLGLGPLLLTLLSPSPPEEGRDRGPGAPGSLSGSMRSRCWHYTNLLYQISSPR